MLYISDHGESLGENSLYLHGLPYFMAPDTQTHVAAMAWFEGVIEKSIDVKKLRSYSDKPLARTTFSTLYLVFLKLKRNSMIQKWIFFMTSLSLNKQLILSIALLAITLIVFQETDLDLYTEDLFYNFTTHHWLIDRKNKLLNFIFYSGIKEILIFFALSVLIALIFFRKKSLVQDYKKGLMIVLLSAIFIPLVIGELKAVTNTPCPKNIHHYDGNYPDLKVFDPYPTNFKQECIIKCWPAGHASGGFALLSLFFLFKQPSNRKKAILFALMIGWSMGTYKMLIGDHFLSHTIITMLLAWAIILTIVYFIEKIDSHKIARVPT
jgi:membrane-associated PAP2 superfamily phosphatase